MTSALVRWEPLGDRDGHAISVSEFSCRYEGGPFDGATMTGTNIWEWDKASATLLAGSGVTRRPGANAVWQNSDGKLALTMNGEGKVTGWTSSGRGSLRMATGAAAGSAGKPYSWTASPTGPGRFSVDVKQE